MAIDFDRAAIDVADEPDRSRYEIAVDGKVVGYTEYRAAGDVLVFPHTLIDRPLRGQGLGDRLVRGALDDVRRRGLTVVARCWFVDEFIDANPEFASLRVSGAQEDRARA